MNSITRDNPIFGDDDIVEIARSVEPHDFDRIAPPPQVWNNILAEFEVAIAVNEATARRQSRRWFSSSRLLTAAAATVLMVGIVAAVVTSRDDNPSVEQLATTMMTDDGLPVSTSATAQAEWACTDDGCFVEVDLSEVPDAGDGDLELWVINGDVTDMHSLGQVTSSGQFRLPADVTPEQFPIVDISIEPRDGEPTHSGQSVLRGVLEET